MSTSVRLKFSSYLRLIETKPPLKHVDTSIAIVSHRSESHESRTLSKTNFAKNILATVFNFILFRFQRINLLTFFICFGKHEIQTQHVLSFDNV